MMNMIWRSDASQSFKFHKNVTPWKVILIQLQNRLKIFHNFHHIEIQWAKKKKNFPPCNRPFNFYTINAGSSICAVVLK